MTSFRLYPLINHGNVLPVSRSARASPAGAVHAVTLSLAALRKLGFPCAPGEPSDAAADLAAQTALVALALVAMTGRLEAGYHLRSGCDLIPRQPPKLECLGPSLAEITPLPLDRAAATALPRLSVYRASRSFCARLTDNRPPKGAFLTDGGAPLDGKLSAWRR